MRDPDRIKPFLELLQRTWSANPDLRIGQLIVNAASLGGWASRDVFYVEDPVVEEGLRHMLERFQ
jgi:uncharacterized protein YihD (DUF1040 family)